MARLVRSAYQMRGPSPSKHFRNAQRGCGKISSLLQCISSSSHLRRRAGGRSFFEASVGGFMAANSRKSSCRTTGSTSPLSVRHKLPSAPCGGVGVGQLKPSTCQEIPYTFSKPSVKAVKFGPHETKFAVYHRRTANHISCCAQRLVSRVARRDGSTTKQLSPCWAMTDDDPADDVKVACGAVRSGQDRWGTPEESQIDSIFTDQGVRNQEFTC